MRPTCVDSCVDSEHPELTATWSAALQVAALTPDYSGAELAALANEAAIRAVRRGSDSPSMADFEGAVQTFLYARRRQGGLQQDLLSRAKGLLM